MGQCIKCGTGFIGTAANPPGDGICHYCERDQLKADKTKLRKALAELVGADTKEELEQMEIGLRAVPGIERDKIAALNAIHALQDCAGIVPADPSELEKLRDLAREYNYMLNAVRCAYSQLEPSRNNPVPSLMAVRAALEALKPYI